MFLTVYKTKRETTQITRFQLDFSTQEVCETPVYIIGTNIGNSA